MFDQVIDAFLIGIMMGMVIGWLMARKTRHDIKEVIDDRHVEEELQSILMEKQIRDGEELENEE
mgnify:CR=1 FL=1